MKNDRFVVLERFAPMFEVTEPSFDGFLRRRDRRRRNQRVAARTVGVAVFAAVVWAVTTVGPVERTRPPGDPTEDIPGLADEGATPSTPAQGDLVLHLEGISGGFLNLVWVYEDGRVIWFRQDYLPSDPNERSTGLFEQLLTSEGIDFLRSEALSTGLFEHDLALDKGRDVPYLPYLSIQVLNGDRTVRVTWASPMNFRIGEDAPFATAEQADALELLYNRITDPTSWPAAAWEDRELTEYIPSRYSICIRGIPEAVRPSRVVPLLPQPAQDLLESGGRAREEDLPANGSCFRLTTENARSLAEILDTAISPIRESRFWLRYTIEDPDTPGNEILISFGPVLPHGEAIFLGPG
jgi:hypothetical protein